MSRPKLAEQKHPYADLIDLVVDEQRAGFSRCVLTVGEKHLNPHHVVHGAVLYAMADTGMGAALYPTLGHNEFCATIEMKINYFKPVTDGPVECTSHLINRGKTVAHLEANLAVSGALVAKASANFAIIPRKAPKTAPA